jgi:hypothetical protein
VLAPFAVTVPLSVAVVGAMAVAASVTTVGGVADAELVVNVISFPQEVPPVFVAQTW